jgi:hypothetical protein
MNHKLRVAAQVALLLLSALPAFPYRRGYLVTLGGERKAGSEVCFYHGVSGNAFSLFFTPGQVRCLPADSVLDLPPGHFNYFARHKDGYASALRDYTIYDGPPMPERGFQQLEIPLLPAATLDFGDVAKSLSSSQSVGVWLAPTQDTPGAFLPLVTGETTILAPADTPIVPLLIENGMPKSVGELLYLEPGQRETIRPFEQKLNLSDVIAWVLLDKESAREARSVLEGPGVTLDAAGKSFRPVAPLFEPGSYTLLIFKDVPRGPAALRLGGTTWQSIKRDIQVRDAMTIELAPLLMVARGSVLVRWATAGIAATPVACREPQTKDLPRVAASVLKCEATVAGPGHCSSIATRSSTFEPSSAIALDGLPAGSYFVAFRTPDGKEQRFPVTILIGRRETVDVTLTPFTFFGTLKLNGEPLHARLIFATGQAVSDENGRYTASLAAPPSTNNIRVETCDSPRSFDHYPSEPITPNTPYDIDLHIMPLHVRVLDPQKKPLAEAGVMICVVKTPESEGRPLKCHRTYSLGTTDSAGLLNAEIRSDYQIQMCASHSQFVRKCGELIDPAKLPSGKADLQFEPVGQHGRVEGHIGTGMVTFVAPPAAVTEQVNLAPEGTFVTRLRHASPEYVVYASATRPLTVLSLPPQNSEDLVISIPPVPSRSFKVAVPEMTEKFGFVGVWVGGRYVPLLTLDFHQTSRGVDSMIYRGKSLEIRDIAETGPITVAYGAPDSTAKTFVDIFTLPQFAGIRTHEVTSGSISIPVK